MCPGELRNRDAWRLLGSQGRVVVGCEHHLDRMSAGREAMEGELWRRCRDHWAVVDLIMKVPLARHRLLVNLGWIDEFDSRDGDLDSRGLLLGLLLLVDEYGR